MRPYPYTLERFITPLPTVLTVYTVFSSVENFQYSVSIFYILSRIHRNDGVIALIASIRFRLIFMKQKRMTMELHKIKCDHSDKHLKRLVSEY